MGKLPVGEKARVQNLEGIPKAAKKFCSRTPVPVSVGLSRRAAKTCHPALGNSAWQEQTLQIHFLNSNREALCLCQHPKGTLRAPGTGGISGLAQQPHSSLKDVSLVDTDALCSEVPILNMQNSVVFLEGWQNPTDCLS